MTTENSPPSLAVVPCDSRKYTQLTVRYDKPQKAIWGYTHTGPRPCVTTTLLSDLSCWYDRTRNEIDCRDARAIDYLVVGSTVPGVFNLGGDLEHFTRLIANNDAEGLYNYGKECVTLAHQTLMGLERNVTTICLVQGSALGGGFEFALSANVLVAERSARMGFPEILFNLFPGMGAYSLLSRRLDGSRAKQMILSGRIYSAEELYGMGLVDVLAEDGQGEAAVVDYMRRESRARNGHRALRAAMNRVSPVTYDELLDVLEIWADAALQLQPRDLRMMARLVMRQYSQHSVAA